MHKLSTLIYTSLAIRGMGCKENIWFLCISVNLLENANCYLMLWASPADFIAQQCNRFVGGLFAANISKYLQGRDHGSLADGNSSGFPMLPLHQDHRQLLRGCTSKDHQPMMMMLMIAECLPRLTGFGPWSSFLVTCGPDNKFWSLEFLGSLVLGR